MTNTATGHRPSFKIFQKRATWNAQDPQQRVHMVQRKFEVALDHSQSKYKYKDAYKHKEKRQYMVK